MSAVGKTETPRPRRGLFAGWFGSARQAYAIPEGRRVYAIGDVHGRLDLLDQLLGMIERDAAGASVKSTLVFLGDYIDRGPDSKGVIDRLMDVARQREDSVFLLGNHDQSMLDFVRDPSVYSKWRSFGAAQTLLSYGLAPPLFDEPEKYAALRDEFVAECPPEHLEFLARLEPFRFIGGYMFVHAGVRPGVPLESQQLTDLLWIRDDFLASGFPHDRRIVHGHTPTDQPVVRPNRLGVDTGAYATGRLTAAVLQGVDCRFLSTR